MGEIKKGPFYIRGEKQKIQVSLVPFEQAKGFEKDKVVTMPLAAAKKFVQGLQEKISELEKNIIKDGYERVRRD